MPNNRDYIIDIFHFLSKTENLKNTLRTSHTSNGRQESTAEHSWMLSLLALLIIEKYPDLDHVKILSFCIIHDIAESITGDIPAPENDNKSKKEEDELIAMNNITDYLPETLACNLLSLYDEYAKGETNEARLVKALDRFETIFQHIIGINQDDFDYNYNLTYGENLTSFDEFTKEIRSHLNNETRKINRLAQISKRKKLYD
ncbi:HD family hydrolase [Hafnia sp. HMSC23F03]|uniref:HD domain-containing protein n=1 Tax=Hafnia sp. HMSC23F03 TaxID=1581059 RepID=UPI0008A1BBCB|nr:HD domain-containing protein [Hafnia sp. HMSC23F03]OFS10261.1 hypothetical protein HMPREF3091_10740 [Hafnia sp. HMSC23F03]